MARTQITGASIADGKVYREDLNTQTPGKAVVTKIIAGSGVTISGTGIDEGTGDVTIDATSSIDSWNLVVIEDNYSAEINDHIFTDGTAVLTITLPAGTPNDNDKIKITDISGIIDTENVTVDGNSNNIQRSSDDLISDVNDKTFILVWVTTLSSWIVEV